MIMTKKHIIIPFILLLTACSQQPGNSANKISKDSLNDTAGTATPGNSNKATMTDTIAQILPGKRIGHISIGEPMENLVTVLGKPDSSDAGMGAEQLTWFSVEHKPGYRTDVYGHANFNGKDDNVRPVKLISVSSPLFKTSKGLGVDADYNTIKRHYTLQHVATNTNTATKIYDDIEAGIAFEIDKGDKCVAVLVHAPGDSVASRIALKQGIEPVSKK